MIKVLTLIKDALESTFGKIRAIGVTCPNPRPVDIIRRMRLVILGWASDLQVFNGSVESPIESDSGKLL